MVEHILLMVECVSVFCTTFALVIKTNSIMKEIKIVEKGENFTTVNVGKLNEIKEYELAMGNFSIPGRCLPDMHYKQQAQNCLSKVLQLGRIMAHAIPINPTKSFISFLKVKAFSM